MSSPPTPVGYSNWNAYIEEQGAIVAAAQGLTFQQGKASVKLLSVATPGRTNPASPDYMIYNVFDTWANITVSPTIGRPWRIEIDSGSIQFNGGNYLSVAGGAGTAMSTDNFTWETYVYPTSSTGYQAFIDTRTNPLGGGDTTGFYFGTNDNTLTPIYYTDSLQLASSINITINSWNHVALTRNGGTVTLWVNGVSGGTKSDTTNLTEQRVFVGGVAIGGLNLTGSISNLRIVKGTAVYTAPFTPPTAPLTAITNTQLLMNMSTSGTAYIDSSVNAFTVTAVGTPSWSALNPF